MAITPSIAPWGSASTAMRPGSMSVGGTVTVAPSPARTQTAVPGRTQLPKFQLSPSS